MPSMRFAVFGLALFALASCAHQASSPEVGSSVEKASPARKPIAAAPVVEGKRNAGTAPAVKPEDLVRRMSDFYKGLKSFHVRADTKIHIEAQGMNNTMTTQTNVVFERPNRLAMKPESGSGPMSVTVVSNGKTIYTLFDMLKRYTKREAPKTLGQLAQDPFLSAGMGMGGPGNFVLLLLADDPYHSLMKQVTSSKDLGATTLDGRPARHLQFTQDGFDWETWIGTGPEPLLLEATFDMSKLMRKAGQKVPGGSAMKLTMDWHFLDWKLNIAPKADAFVFAPPKDAKETNDLLGRAAHEEDEELSPLVGKAAPPVDLELLDGKRFKLADHVGKDVVMLDLWATWCGPCCRELPLLADIAHEYQSRGVAFYAVNQGEEKKKVADFLKREKLDLTVALDTEGSVGNAYGADAIPLLVLIGKKGIVESVHVGYSPDVKEILHKELDALLAGKNLAAEAVSARKAQKAKAATSVAAGGLETAWTVSGPYSGTAWDPHSKSVFAIKHGGHCDVLGLDGKVKRSFGSDGSVLRLARLQGPDQADLLAFQPWGQSIAAYATGNGGVLWRENNETGVDDVWAADLDGDGRDEVIIGYNGFAGLHVLGPDGRPRWKTTKIGNVWHVSAGDVNGDKKIEVVSTSASGKVHVFAADGKPLATFDAPFYANGIRVARLSKEDAADTILLTGSSHGGESMAAMNGKGHALWTLPFPEGISHVESFAVSSTRPWAAIGAPGRLLVADLATRRFVAAADVRGRQIDVTWAIAADGQTPLLLVADGNQLSAFRIKPTPVGAANQKQAKR